MGFVMAFSYTYTMNFNSIRLLLLVPSLLPGELVPLPKQPFHYARLSLGFTYLSWSYPRDWL